MMLNELVKKVNNIDTTDASNLIKKNLTMTQKLVKLKKNSWSWSC